MSKTTFNSCEDFDIAFSEINYVYTESFEHWQEKLKIKVNYNADDLTHNFMDSLAKDCKKLIPKGQSRYIAEHVIPNALPWSEEYKFPIQIGFLKYEFSCRGGEATFIPESFNLDNMDRDNTGSAEIWFHLHFNIDDGLGNILEKGEVTYTVKLINF
jgi:hypothetical protein